MDVGEMGVLQLDAEWEYSSTVTIPAWECCACSLLKDLVNNHRLVCRILAQFPYAQ